MRKERNPRSSRPRKEEKRSPDSFLYEIGAEVKTRRAKFPAGTPMRFGVVAARHLDTIDTVTAHLYTVRLASGYAAYLYETEIELDKRKGAK